MSSAEIRFNRSVIGYTGNARRQAASVARQVGFNRSVIGYTGNAPCLTGCFIELFFEFGEAICSQTAVLRKNAENLRIASFSCITAQPV